MRLSFCLWFIPVPIRIRSLHPVLFPEHSHEGASAVFDSKWLNKIIVLKNGTFVLLLYTALGLRRPAVLGQRRKGGCEEQCRHRRYQRCQGTEEVVSHQKQCAGHVRVERPGSAEWCPDIPRGSRFNKGTGHNGANWLFQRVSCDYCLFFILNEYIFTI